MAVAVAAVLVAQAVNGGTSCEWWHPLGKVAAVLVAHAVAERVVVALLAPVVPWGAARRPRGAPPPMAKVAKVPGSRTRRPSSLRRAASSYQARAAREQGSRD